MIDSIIGVEFRKGIAQGREQGREQGRLDARREDLILLLSQKFPARVDESSLQHIATTDDPNVLKQWVQAVGLAKSWKQFVKAAGWPSTT